MSLLDKSVFILFNEFCVDFPVLPEYLKRMILIPSHPCGISDDVGKSAFAKASEDRPSFTKVTVGKHDGS